MLVIVKLKIIIWSFLLPIRNFLSILVQVLFHSLLKANQETSKNYSNILMEQHLFKDGIRGGSGSGSWFPCLSGCGWSGLEGLCAVFPTIFVLYSNDCNDCLKIVINTNNFVSVITL